MPLFSCVQFNGCTYRLRLGNTKGRWKYSNEEHWGILKMFADSKPIFIQIFIDGAVRSGLSRVYLCPYRFCSNICMPKTSLNMSTSVKTYNISAPDDFSLVHQISKIRIQAGPFRSNWYRPSNHLLLTFFF